jgi:hypothetical protein
MLSYVLFQSRTGPLLADWSAQARDITIETTPRGYGACEALIPLPKRQARQWYGQLDGAHLVVRERGQTVYEGRVEIPETTPEGLRLTAFGYSRAYSDVPVTDMWSTISVAEWAAVTADSFARCAPDLYEMDTDNRLFIGLQKNSVYRTGLNTIDVGAMTYTISGLVGPLIRRFAASYAVLLPTNWRMQVDAYNAGFVSGVSVFSIVATGALQTGSFDVTAIGDRTILIMSVYNNTGVNVTYAGENSTSYARLTDIRIASSTSATITADEVVRRINAAVAATNPGQASGVTARIQSPGFDLKEYAYDRVYAEDVLDQLAALGGDGHLWSWRVWRDQILIFDRTASDRQVYQIYATPDVSRDLGSLRTRIRPVYTDEADRTQLGTAQISLAAERRYGLKRIAYFSAPTSSAADANALASHELIDRQVVNAWGDITVTELWQNGQRVPLTVLRSGDVVECIEFPSTGNSETDKTRRFRVAVTSYSHSDRTLTISPEQRGPKIDSLLAQRDVSLVGG